MKQYVIEYQFADDEHDSPTRVYFEEKRKYKAYTLYDKWQIDLDILKYIKLIEQEVVEKELYSHGS